MSDAKLVGIEGADVRDEDMLGLESKDCGVAAGASVDGAVGGVESAAGAESIGGDAAEGVVIKGEPELGRSVWTV